MPDSEAKTVVGVKITRALANQLLTEARALGLSLNRYMQLIIERRDVAALVRDQHAEIMARLGQLGLPQPSEPTKISGAVRLGTPPPEVPEGMKYCRRGDHVVPLSDFGARTDVPGALKSICRACEAQAAKERRDRRREVAE